MYSICTMYLKLCLLWGQAAALRSNLPYLSLTRWRIGRARKDVIRGVRLVNSGRLFRRHPLIFSILHPL